MAGWRAHGWRWLVGWPTGWHNVVSRLAARTCYDCPVEWRVGGRLVGSLAGAGSPRWCRVWKNEEMRATRRRRVIYRRRGHKVRISRACLDASVVQATPHLHVTFPASTRHLLVLERRAGDAPFTRHLQALHATFPHPLVPTNIFQVAIGPEMYT